MTDRNNGFWFDEVKHKYYLDGKLMTGTTTCLGVLAKPALIPWASNLGAAEAFLKASEMGPDALNAFAQDIQAAIEKFGKINGAACQWLDARNPAFKLARQKHTERKEAAGAHGTDTHALIERYVKLCLERDGKPQVSTTAPEIIQPFIAWALANVDKFLFSERPMHDPNMFFAGTADFGYVGKDGLRYMGDFKTSSGIYGIDYWLQVAGYRYLAECEGDEPYQGMTVVRIGKDDGKFEVVSMYEYDTFRDVFLSCVRIYRAQQAVDGLTVKSY